MLSDALALAKAGGLDILLIYKVDRFAGNQMRPAEMWMAFDSAGTEVVSATEPIGKGAMGHYMRNSYTFAAEFERVQILKRTMRGKRPSAEKRRIPARPRPLDGLL